jgi:hypothetical protein
MEKVDDSKPAINVWPAFMDAVRTNEADFEKLRALVDGGGVDFTEDYSQINLNGYIYFSPVRLMTMNLSRRAILGLHQGRMEEAWHDLISLGNASQLTAKIPPMINQLVGYACMAIAVSGEG